MSIIKCPKCGEVRDEKNNILRIHHNLVKRTFSSSRKYMCCICSKRFFKFYFLRKKKAISEKYTIRIWEQMAQKK